ncbi:MAG: desulfoferrodoxin [Planctomycetes bacterium]|nr:desulfoferrodoxin [Planctomycetota bacterium]
MKRREFLSAAAGIGAGTISVATAGVALGKEKPPQEKRLQIYRCEECGTITEILEPGEAPIVHCGKPMTLVKELVEGEGAVKHVPVVEKIDGGYKVKVGEVTHPMTRAHRITWIELIADGKSYRKFLEADAVPEATFLIEAKEVTARAYCNLHSLWKTG